MPEKRAAPKARPTKKPAAKKALTATKTVAAKTSPRPAPVRASASEARLVCPRCGTAKFGPEQRIRAEGSRTVRYSILVCERGHTFAHPLVTSG